MALNFTRLKNLVPDPVIAQLTDVVNKFSINTPLRLSHFLAQTDVESAHFSRFIESLNYSAYGLANTWPSKFAKVAATTPKTTYVTVINKFGKKRNVPNDLAIKFGRDDQKKRPADQQGIANTAYGSKMGNIESGDGFKFRGRGFIQLTGKANYDSFGRAIKIDCINNPDLVSTTYQLLSAAWFWNYGVVSKNGVINLNSIADHGNGEDVVTQITAYVNGGSNGLDQRQHLFHVYFDALKQNF